MPSSRIYLEETVCTAQELGQPASTALFLNNDGNDHPD
jgi:hypothetical protein